MERVDYRDNLEEVLSFSGGAHLLTAKAVGQFIGKDYRTARKMFDFRPDGYISAATLARQLCSERRTV